MDMSDTQSEGADQGVEQSDTAEERVKQSDTTDEHVDAEEMPSPSPAPHDGTGSTFHDGTGNI